MIKYVLMITVFMSAACVHAIPSRSQPSTEVQTKTEWSDVAWADVAGPGSVTGFAYVEAHADGKAWVGVHDTKHRRFYRVTDFVVDASGGDARDFFTAFEQGRIIEMHWNAQGKYAGLGPK